MQLYREDGTLEKRVLAKQTISGEVVWIDLLNSTAEEEELVKNVLEIAIPSQKEMQDIEVSRRLYRRDDAIYMTATLVTNYDTSAPENLAFTFILTDNKLITIRYANPEPFRAVFDDIKSSFHNHYSNIDIYIDLVESIVEHIADMLETLNEDLNKLSLDTIRSPTFKKKNNKPDYKQLFEQIGCAGDLLSKISESLVTLNRMISYALQHACINNIEHTTQLSTSFKDIKALSDHANFLSNKVNFLLDTALGMINIEQNNIIKIFSVMAAVLLPPTLIANIYGMNFEFIPELKWYLGYPFALAIMVLSSWLSYKYFKRNGWL